MSTMCPTCHVFASVDVQNRHLENGSRCAFVGLVGFIKNYPLCLRYVRVLGKRTRPLNLSKLNVVIEPWGDISREMILSARKTIDDVV